MAKQELTHKEYQRQYTLKNKGSFRTVKFKLAVYEKLAKCSQGFEKPAITVERVIDYYIKQHGI